MNDIIATLLSLGILYLVLKFAFGGPSTNQSTSAALGRGEHTPAMVAAAHQQQQQRQQAAAAASSPKNGSSTSRDTLISRYNLEKRIADKNALDSPSPPAVSSAYPAMGTGPVIAGKGKGKMTDEQWKQGADARRDELRRRKEEMILEARRKMLAKQQPASVVTE